MYVTEVPFETVSTAAAFFHNVSLVKDLKSQWYRLFFRVNSLRHFLQEVQPFSFIYLVLAEI